VVPSYNHEKFIDEALDSIEQQTYSYIEVIIVDDCSNDATLLRALTWLKRVTEKRRFLRVLVEQNNDNLGAHATINRGLAIAQGDWLTILNSDDRYHPMRIERLVECAQETSGKLLFTGVRVIDETGNRPVYSKLAAEIESAVDFPDAYHNLSFALLKRNIAISTGNLFFSREVYQRVGGFRSMKYCHDWDFVLRAMLLTEPVMLSDYLYDYRIHSSNSFSSLKLEQYLETLACYRAYFMSCRAGNCTNPIAPTLSNWPLLFDKFVADDGTLSNAYYLIGDDNPRYDQIMISIRTHLSNS
jgi:glycosyltransferase involved in cell wall biosynthesis